MLLAAALALVLIVVMAAGIFAANRAQDSAKWHWHETASGPVMRRRVGGKWETRPMTEDEARDYAESRAGW